MVERQLPNHREAVDDFIERGIIQKDAAAA
jgi:hypothetical protein